MIELMQRLHVRLFSSRKWCEQGRREGGFSLLEYAAGAAVLAGVVYTGMYAFGEGLETFFTALGRWTAERGEQLNSSGVGIPQ